MPSTKTARIGDEWLLSTELKNTSQYPALMIRLKVVGKKSGDCLLPVLYSDNYIFLLPGETSTITMRVRDADVRGEKPIVKIEGLNIR